MSVLRNLFFAGVAVVSVAFTQIEAKEKIVIEGTVVTGKTNTPVPQVHVYVLDGEEEALTNSKGEFKITTWQSLPVTVTAEHAQYETQRIRVSNAGQRQQIVLKKK